MKDYQRIEGEELVGTTAAEGRHRIPFTVIAGEGQGPQRATQETVMEFSGHVFYGDADLHTRIAIRMRPDGSFLYSATGPDGTIHDRLWRADDPPVEVWTWLREVLFGLGGVHLVAMSLLGVLLDHLPRLVSLA